MKKSIVVAFAAALWLSCSAEEHTNKTAVVKPPKLPGDAPPWTVVVRRLTNAVPVRQQTEFEVKVFTVPVQMVQWFNADSNIWETIEQPMTAPRLVTEYMVTNVVNAGGK